MPRILIVAGLGFLTWLYLAGSGAPVSSATGPYTVYGDALAPGWSNWSWNSTVNFGVTGPVYAGTHAIAWTAKRAWAGLYLHTDSAVSAAPYTSLTFAVRATQAGQSVGIVLEDVQDNPLGPELKLSSYGGDPVGGVWKTYTLPLSALGATDKGIGGVVIEDESGSSEPTLYADEIQLTAAAGETVTTTPAQPTPSPSPTQTHTPTPQPPTPASSSYPWHTNITAVVFWIGEIYDPSSPNGSQVYSAYDSQWMTHYGGCDGDTSSGSCQTEHLSASNGYFPLHIMPHENPYYLDLPFDDLNNRKAFAERCQVIPWANQPGYAGHCIDGNQSDQPFSYMKNRWVHLQRNGRDCYGQIEDAGPFAYHDATYVFGAGDARPASATDHHAGLDVSPALRDCLSFTGSSPQDQLDNDSNSVNWQFVDGGDVPSGPWTRIITASPVTP